MKTIAVIAEYDPFHNGHAHLLQEARKICAADCILVLLSSEFVQRGTPAAFSARSRATMALAGGADLVLLNPTRFVVQSAGAYAKSAVAQLAACGIVDTLVFGSECGELARLQEAADALDDEDNAQRAALQAALKEGHPYPLARAMAFPAYADLLKEPNNLLGIEYLRAIRATNAKMKAVTLPRVGQAHQSNDITGPYASATAIRRALAAGKPIKELRSVLPAASLTAMENEIPLDLDDLSEALLSRLHLARSYEDYLAVCAMDEDLARRIFELRHHCTSFSAFVQAVQTRTWTGTHIQRALLCLALGLKKDADKKRPRYLQVQGIREEKRDLLSTLSETATLPVLVRPGAKQKELPDDAREFFAEETALRSYALALRAKKSGSSVSENPLSASLLTM